MAKLVFQAHLNLQTELLWLFTSYPHCDRQKADHTMSHLFHEKKISLCHIIIMFIYFFFVNG